MRSEPSIKELERWIADKDDMDALDHFWHVCAALMARVKRAHHGSSCAACGVSLGFRAHYCTTCLAAASEPHKTPLIKAKDGHGRDTG